jgi:hypothetical protein
VQAIKGILAFPEEGIVVHGNFFGGSEVANV